MQHTFEEKLKCYKNKNEKNIKIQQQNDKRHCQNLKEKFLIANKRKERNLILKKSLEVIHD